MTTAQMIAEVRATLAYDQDAVRLLDGDGIPVELADARILEFLNEALDALGTLCRIRATVSLTLSAGVSRYAYDSSAFSRRVARLLSLGTGGAGHYALSNAPVVPGLPNGVPMRYETFEREVALSPPPSVPATYIAEAYVLPTRLDAAVPGATCELPSELHRSACRWAAVELARPYATESQQRVRLSDEHAIAEQKALAIGRASIVASSRGGSRSGGATR